MNDEAVASAAQIADGNASNESDAAISPIVWGAGARESANGHEARPLAGEPEGGSKLEVPTPAPRNRTVSQTIAGGTSRTERARLDLGQLVNSDAPAWPVISNWIQRSPYLVEALPADPLSRSEALVQTQLSVRAPLGAIVYETGGILIDHGWIRLLGAGHPRLPRTLPGWNRGRSSDPLGKSRGFYLVGDDVLGGLFAIDAGGLGFRRSEICYFSPDTLRWEPMGYSFARFLHWCLSGDLAGYYATMRWDDWQRDSLCTLGDQALLVTPPLFTQGAAVAKRRRESVAMVEIYRMYVEEWAPRLGGLSDGTRVAVPA